MARCSRTTDMSHYGSALLVMVLLVSTGCDQQPKPSSRGGLTIQSPMNQDKTDTRGITLQDVQCLTPDMKELVLPAELKKQLIEELRKIDFSTGTVGDSGKTGPDFELVLRYSNNSTRMVILQGQIVLRDKSTSKLYQFNFGAKVYDWYREYRKNSG